MPLAPVPGPFALRPHPRFQPPPGPLVLLILDGVGVGPGDAFDAVAMARTPTLDGLRSSGLYRTLRAHGTAAGLPSDADMGNSEVGHNIIGAGRVFDQGAKLVDRALESGTVWKGVWREMLDFLDGSGGALHLIGLLSDGNVHSHQQHLFALIRQAAAAGQKRLFVHPLQDGRDVPETSALVYVDRLEEVLAEAARGGKEYKIASGGGRMVTTMDRYEADWSIVERGWRAHVLGEGRGFASARQAIETFRAEKPGVIDQFLPPYVIHRAEGKPVAPVLDGDAVIFFNFRGDRAMEISRAFEGGPEFDKFDRVRVPRVFYAGMMLYDGDLGIPRRFLVAPPEVDRTFPEYLAKNQIAQFATAETQKYGHVTYFWNGNRSGMFDSRYEVYVEIPSDRLPFEQRPWMKAAQTADQVIQAAHSGAFRFIRANFAAGDMVGHTGVLEAAVQAVQAVDLAVARILRAVRETRGTLVVTADHGNADDMVERDKTGAPQYDPSGRPRARTSHTLNPVPFFLFEASGREFTLREDLPEAGIGNIAGTLLQLLGYCPPTHFDPALLEER